MYKHFIWIFLFAISVGCKKTPTDPVVNFPVHVAYVVSGGSRTVEVIDLDSMKVYNSFSISSNAERFPHHIYLSKDKKMLAVANPAYDFSLGHSGLHGKQIPGGVIVLDAVTGKVLKDFEVPFANHNALFSCDGSEIWTTGLSHSGRAYIYDFNSTSLVKEIILDADPSEIIFSKNGTYAAVASGESTFLQVIDQNKKEIEKKIKVDLSPSNVWEGYGNIVLVSNSLKKSVNFVDLSTFQVTDFIDFDFVPGFLTYNELTQELWVCNGDEGKLRVFKQQPEWTEINSFDFNGKDPHMVRFYDSDSKALLVNQKSNTAVFIDVLEKQIIKEIIVGIKPNGIDL